MELTGEQLIAGRPTAAGKQTFTAYNPANRHQLGPLFYEATPDEADEALRRARDAFDDFRSVPPEKRAELLEAIADEVEGLGDELLTRAADETALPAQRLTGERTRAVNQARMFARVIRDGSWVEARIDRGDPKREPAPKPDVRRMFMPVGPVAVFGAGNFPLAISVIGSDTVSALGAGCPVVLKGHPGHPGTCELLGRAVQRSLEKCGLAREVFSLVQGTTQEVGMALVKHPATQAVAFTGSLKGGRALYDAAAARPNPIPVYAEMGSTNPIFTLPGALRERGRQLAENYIQSVTLGTGQFCTNPGLLFGLAGDAWTAFTEDVARAAGESSPATMLHHGIHQAFHSGLESLQGFSRVNLMARSDHPAQPERTEAACHVFATDAATFLETPELHQEYFGPLSILTQADSPAQLEEVAEALEGQLTATLHGTPEDLRDHERLVRILQRKVGRLIFNGFPTGIEVCAAMHHGGPYPATTHSHFTSIGTASIFRFVRPICYQNFPQEALPPELRDRNERGIWRLIDQEFTRNDA